MFLSLLCSEETNVGKERLHLFINSRTAIAGSIIGLLLFFLPLEEEYWFLRLEEKYWFSLVFTTRRGVLVFLRFLRLEEEYWFLRLEDEYWFSLGFFFYRK